MLNYLFSVIHWNPDPVIFRIGGIAPLWYSTTYLVGFLIGYYIVYRMFKKDGVATDSLDMLLLLLILGTILGARLGHCLFYDWAYYKTHLLEILLPIQTEPTLKFIGFMGLASHGGAIGILVAQWYYARKVIKKSLVWLLDRVGIPTLLVASLIRLGNLMNSEIIGNPTDVSWAFVFEKVDQIPRHPVQLYEAIAYFILFLFMSFLYWKTNIRHQIGRLLGIYTVILWSTRFVLEYFKRDMGGIEESLGMLSTGQWLSIPLILVGLYFMLRPLPKA